MSDDLYLDSVNRGGQDPGGQDPAGQDPAGQDLAGQDLAGQDSGREKRGQQDPGRRDGRPLSPHLLTWWFGLMAIGGVAFGLDADEHPFGRGVLAHPLVVFAACVLAGLLTLRFLHARPVMQLISARSLAGGAIIGVACFFFGRWFGVSLIHMP
jgi:hypothetical protein